MNSPVLSESKFNVYGSVTEKIVEAIRKGVGTYTMPWHGGGPAICIPVNAATEAPYRGVNILALWAVAAIEGYESGQWASYRQWQSLGAQVRGGERGSIIVFVKEIEGAEKDKKEEEGERPRLVARAYRVFNAAQVEGWESPPPARIPEFFAIKEIDAFVQATGANIRHGAPMARYHPKEDFIEMPDRERFIGSATSTSTETYYSVLLHELTHFSGASHRLNRQFGARFGDRAYAMEELVAELGAAFLCAALGIANEPRQDHAAYVASWLEVLDHDHKAIFMAASQAQKAVEYLAQLAKANNWRIGV
jgi:antirestriction protein ArdC